MLFLLAGCHIEGLEQAGQGADAAAQNADRELVMCQGLSMVSRCMPGEVFSCVNQPGSCENSETREGRQDFAFRAHTHTEFIIHLNHAPHLSFGDSHHILLRHVFSCGTSVHHNLKDTHTHTPSPIGLFTFIIYPRHAPSFGDGGSSHILNPPLII